MYEVVINKASDERWMNWLPNGQDYVYGSTASPGWASGSGTCLKALRQWIAYVRPQGDSKDELVKVPFGAPSNPVVLPSDVPASDIAWAPTNDWICYSATEGFGIVSPDGKDNRLLLQSPIKGVFGFSNDGRLLYVVRGTEETQRELIHVEVPGGTRCQNRSASTTWYAKRPERRCAPGW